jgi:hypothetical protein
MSFVQLPAVPDLAGLSDDDIIAALRNTTAAATPSVAQPLGPDPTLDPTYADDTDDLGDTDDLEAGERPEPTFTIREDSALVARIRELFDLARNSRRNMVELWDAAYEYLHTQRPAPGARNPELPEMFPIIESLIGWETDQRPTFEAAPISTLPGAGREYLDNLARDLEY